MSKNRIYFLIVLTLQCSVLVTCPFASGRKHFEREAPEALSTLSVDSKKIKAHFENSYSIALMQLRSDYESQGHSIENQIALINERIESSSDAKALLPLKNALSLLKIEPDLVNQADYINFIRELRRATTYLDQEALQCSFCTKIIRDLSELHFRLNLNQSEMGYDFFFNLLPEKYQALKAENLNVRELNREINQIFPKRSPSLILQKMSRKAHYFSFMNWDPAFYSVRSQLAELYIDNRCVSVLRMGCPIMGSNSSPKVDPLFLSYLKVLKNKGEKHLYINNQNIVRRGSEKKSSNLLNALAHQEEYQTTFYFITLPYNSTFYKQENLGRVQAQTFINLFAQHIQLNEEGFYFPETLRAKESFKAYLRTLFEMVHKTYFDEADFLVQRERSQFIDIAYAYIAHYLIEDLKIDSVNWTCKHGIDRAMSAFSVFDKLLKSHLEEKSSLESTLYISYWPAMAYYHRPPDINRTIRALSAIEKLSEAKSSFSNSDSIQSVSFLNIK